MTQAGVRRLVVCVDDFGQQEGVNQAVLDLLAMRRISATSCLVDGPAWAEGAPALKAALRAAAATSLLQTEATQSEAAYRQADVGLHLNLTECLDPVAQANWSCRPVGALIRAAYAHQLDTQALQAEVARQWDRFVAVWGAAPDFVDGHQHVHQLPQVREALLAVLNHRLPASGSSPWLRCCRAPGWRAVGKGLGVADTAKAQLIGALGSAALAQQAHARGWRTSAHLLGVYPFDADAAAYLQRWQAWLQLAEPAGDVLMCHPAKPGIDTGSAPDPIAASRWMEYEVLTGMPWADAVARSGTHIAVLP